MCVCVCVCVTGVKEEEATRAVDPRALPTNDEDDPAQLDAICCTDIRWRMIDSYVLNLSIHLSYP